MPIQKSQGCYNLATRLSQPCNLVTTLWPPCDNLVATVWYFPLILFCLWQPCDNLVATVWYFPLNSALLVTTLWQPCSYIVMFGPNFVLHVTTLCLACLQCAIYVQPCWYIANPCVHIIYVHACNDPLLLIPILIVVYSPPRSYSMHAIIL